MINILDLYLITHQETEKIRKILKSINFDKDSMEFFNKLYKTWSFNPVSTLILCIVSGFYELSYRLILKFSDIKFENDYFIQLAQLIQLFESSSFTNIRILLLEPHKNIYLVKTLYGILLILPQGKAYQALSKRLKTIESLMKIEGDMKVEINGK